MKETVVLVLFSAMAGSWLFRFLLVRALQRRHPADFAAIGEPTSRQLESLLPRHQEMHLRLWKYLWSGRAFLLGDGLVSLLAAATLLSDLAVAGSVAALFLLPE